VTTRYALEVPRLGSFILTHHWDGEVQGLKAFPRDARPPSAIIFWSFRLMVGLGFLMLGLGGWAGWRGWRGRLYGDRRLFRAVVAMGPMGFVAVLAGWVTTEVGRQPWTVYGLLRTAESASPIQAPAVAASLAAFILVGIVHVIRGGLMWRVRRPLQAAQPHRAHVRQAQGLETHRHPIRPLRPHLHERDLHRRNRHLLAMSFEPRSALTKIAIGAIRLGIAGSPGTLGFLLSHQ
jgi:cytochrome bd-type quinol oxidase subunit 1